MNNELDAKARAWLDEDPDPETRSALEALLAAGDHARLAEQFGGTLEFGTAGLRGVLGPGPMSMNQVVVRRATAGLADYLLATVPRARERGVVIAYDCRKNSRLFAEDAARVLAGKGIRALLGDELLPTPAGAFAVVETAAAAGIIITASHNPPEYNGYKVYWDNGAQIIPPHDTGIAAAIAQVGRTDELPMPELAQARAQGLIVPIANAVIDRYLAGVRALSVHPDAPAKARTVIAYTPMHGVGGALVQKAMAQAGFTELYVEPSQCEPDGSFPTVRFPNPEEPGAMDRVLELATRVQADIALANDPDADRLAVAARESSGSYRMLSGDQIGVLLADYLLSEGFGQDKGPRLVATTIVSSQMLGNMAAAFGVDYRETLTGFKWLANAAMQAKKDHGSFFVMGYEEALGYSVGELVRDKDGVSAAVLFAEMTAQLAARGTTVLAQLEALYRRYGLYITEQKSLTLPGLEGMRQMRAVMQRFRDQPPTDIGGHAVVDSRDLLAGGTDLPPSDVLIFKLAGDRRVIMRPSGTEPKLKSYYEVREPIADGEPMATAQARARAQLAALRDAHQALVQAAV